MPNSSGGTFDAFSTVIIFEIFMWITTVSINFKTKRIGIAILRCSRGIFSISSNTFTTSGSLKISDSRLIKELQAPGKIGYFYSAY